MSILAPVTYRDEYRQLYVAYWYDRLARHLLKSKLLSFDEWLESKGLSRFDLYHDSLFSCVEIKGSSNMDQMKLFSDQLDGQVGELGFPFDSGFIWIFSYRNFQRERGKGSRLLKKNGKTPARLSKFLAENTTSAYAVDVYFLNALRQRYGTKAYTRDRFRDRKIVSVTRTQLREAAAQMDSTLSDIGLHEEVARYLPPKAHRIPSRLVETTLDGCSINFELILLIPNTLKIRLLKLMNGTVKRT